jgi:DNA-binding XRE family transcriptional regulator
MHMKIRGHGTVTTETQNPSQDGITGQQLIDARSRARLTQRELAALLKHSERTVIGWESAGVAAGKVALVRSVLGAHLGGEVGTNPLAQFSDMALLAELARRLDAARNDTQAAATDPE